MDVTVRNISEDLAALALQGPNSRRILKEVLSGYDLPSNHAAVLEPDVSSVFRTLKSTTFLKKVPSSK